MIKSSSYFEDQVKSLGSETGGQPYTVGVMEAGDYSFGTSTVEIMEVVFGFMQVTLPDGEKRTVKKGETFTVAANETFRVTLTEPAAYLCLYR